MLIRGAGLNLLLVFTCAFGSLKYMTAAESPPPAHASVDSQITIAGITELTIIKYFETLNAGDFLATTALFAPQGTLKAPFESPLTGTDAIANYLQAEAQGMVLQPREGIVQQVDDNLQVQVAGRVQTSWCGVNVSWLFVLNQARQITAATVKLLGSPQELLSVRPPNKE